MVLPSNPVCWYYITKYNISLYKPVIKTVLHNYSLLTTTTTPCILRVIVWVELSNWFCHNRIEFVSEYLAFFLLRYTFIFMSAKYKKNNAINNSTLLRYGLWTHFVYFRVRLSMSNILISTHPSFTLLITFNANTNVNLGSSFISH